MKTKIILSTAALFVMAAIVNAQGIVSPKSGIVLGDLYLHKSQEKRITTPSDIAASKQAKEIQAKISIEYNKNKAAKLSKKQKAQALIDAVPAQQKERYDSIIATRNYDKLAAEIKAKQVPYEAQYYILVQTAKKDGTGLVAFGTLKIAQTIINTSFDKQGFVEQEAQAAVRKIHGSGMAL